MAYKKIVCSVTGSAQSQRAALRAAEMAKENNAVLIYVYAVDIDFLRGGLPHREAERSLEHIGENILEQTDRIAAALEVKARRIMPKGPALEVLERVIKAEEADLLVLGHEDRTFFEKTLMKGDVEDHLEELKRKTGIEITVVK